MPARDRRTVGEASADTDALPRGVLLDVKGPNTGQDLAPGFQSPRLLRRAAELVWVAIDTDTAGFHRQLLALGIDLAADEARNLLPDAIPIDGPAPVGGEPASLLRSAEQLLQRVATGEAATGLDGLLARVANLVWEANSDVSD